MAARGPQETPLYKLVALLARPHGHVALEPGARRGLEPVLLMAAAIALAVVILGAAAALANQVWLLLPLGPSAYALLRMPMSERSSPRALVGAHALACAAGVFVGWLSGRIAPAAPPATAGGVHWSMLVEFVAAAALTTALISLLRCVHTPALVTSALAAWGLLASPQSIAALVGAAVLLALEGIVLLRYVAGIPYPLWTADASASRRYGPLAGGPVGMTGFWEELEARLMRRAS